MKITLNEFRELVKERVARLLEIDAEDIQGNVPDEEPINNEEPFNHEEPADVNSFVPPEHLERKPDKYSKISSAANNLAGKLDPKMLAIGNKEIDKILATGKGKYTHQNSLGGGF